MNNRKGDWIETFTGVAFWPLDAHIEDINIEDIAHSLSNQCRFAGHTKEFYSTAQHSVYVSEESVSRYVELYNITDSFVLNSIALKGLLHDGSETYLLDFPRPLKQLPQSKFYTDAEQVLTSLIENKFGICSNHNEIIHYADMKMCALEARDLMRGNHKWWLKFSDYLENSTRTISSCWTPKQAEMLFLDKYYQLTEYDNRI